MTHLATWWAALSWPYAVLVLLAVLLIAGFIGCAIVLRPRPMATRRAAPVVDYSAAVEKSIRWLGERYLLAIPINRIGRRDSWRAVG